MMENLVGQFTVRVSNFSRPFDGIAYWQVYNRRHFLAFAIGFDKICFSSLITYRGARPSGRNRHDRRTAENHLPEWLQSASHKLTTILPWLD